MTYGLQPYDPSSGPPGPTSGYMPGLHAPGTLIPNPEVIARLQDQAASAALADRARAEAALAARRERMVGRWFTPEHTWAVINGEIGTVGLTEHATEQLLDILAPF